MAKHKPKPKRKHATPLANETLTWALFGVRTDLEVLRAKFSARLNVLEDGLAHVQKYVGARRGR